MATTNPLDTNVLVRYLVETPGTIPDKFAAVFDFFRRLEQEEVSAFLPDVVLFQAFFVLTSYYEVPVAEAADKLSRIVSFRGLRMTQKHIALDCLQRIQGGEADLVDAWIAAWCAAHKSKGVYSFDEGIEKLGLKRLPLEQED